MTLYRIANWSTTYENAETRKLVRLSWIPVPNKHDGLGFRLVSAEKDGPALLAAWILIVQLASKSDREERGTLWRDGIPLDAPAMALMTGFPAKIFERALPFFSQPRIAWLLAEPWQTDLPLSPGVPGESPGASGESPGRREGKGRERIEGNVGGAAVAAPASDSEWMAELGQNPAYAGINLAQEHGKMTAWCQANAKQPTRRRFVNWINRCDKPLGAAPQSRPSRQAIREPEGWKSFLNHTYPGSAFSSGGDREAHEWHDLDATTQAKIAREIRMQTA